MTPILSRSDFKIEKCDDCLRITRIELPELHTHVHSKKLADKIIYNVCNEKIPLHLHSRTLESLARLSSNEDYVRKIEEILNTRKRKGKKQMYVNPSAKKSL